MGKDNFYDLFQKYPEIIREMPPVFDSHQFILKLAQQYQKDYINVLYLYRTQPAPFQMVHGILAGKLNQLPELVELIRPDKYSHNIFGDPSTCAEWRKR
jgi:hypothetical protein